MNDTPQGWTQITIGEVLTQAQMNRLQKLHRRADGDLFKFIALVKPWFNEPAMAEQLKARGLLPEFAVYAIPLHYAKALKAQA